MNYLGISLLFLPEFWWCQKVKTALFCRMCWKSIMHDTCISFWYESVLSLGRSRPTFTSSKNHTTYQIQCFRLNNEIFHAMTFKNIVYYYLNRKPRVVWMLSSLSLPITTIRYFQSRGNPLVSRNGCFHFIHPLCTLMGLSQVLECCEVTAAWARRLRKVNRNPKHSCIPCMLIRLYSP